MSSAREKVAGLNHVPNVDEVGGFTTADKLGPTSLAKLEPDVRLAVEASEGDVTAAQVQVLKRTICAKLSIEQLQLYLTICHRKGVDPFTEAYAFPSSEGGLAFGLRIDGMRALAMRTGDYLRREVETILTEPDKDGQRSLVGARCSVWRRGMEAPVVEEAYAAEYNQGRMGWKQFPETMIRKVAESKALRAAFPDALSGIYEITEIRREEQELESD